VTDAVDTPRYRHQQTPVDPKVNLPGPKPGLEELGSSDHPLLGARDLQDQTVRATPIRRLPLPRSKVGVSPRIGIALIASHEPILGVNCSRSARRMQRVPDH
jgi:hypothetical protein